MESQAFRPALEKALKQKGLRVTEPRVAVLEYLRSTCTHPTADEIGAAVKERGAAAARASIYNVLHSLTQAGLVHELVFEDAVARYDARTDRHHHFICSRCGAVEDLSWEALSPPKRHLPAGYTVESVDITLHGRCPGCRE